MTILNLPIFDKNVYSSILDYFLVYFVTMLCNFSMLFMYFPSLKCAIMQPEKKAQKGTKGEIMKESESVEIREKEIHR